MPTILIESRSASTRDADLQTTISSVIEESLLHGDMLLSMKVTRGYYIDRVTGNVTDSALIAIIWSDKYGDQHRENITLHSDIEYNCDFMLGSEV